MTMTASLSSAPASAGGPIVTSANPCWAGAVCLWEHANFGGRHKTFWGTVSEPLSNYGLKNTVSSVCNNTQWYVLLIHDNSWSRNDPYLRINPNKGCLSYVGDTMNDWTTYIKIQSSPYL
jgi:hypothetical protein